MRRGKSIWFAGSSLLSHPDYLPCFNELAESEPEKILVDSDLDWGQDMKRLAKRLKKVGAHELAYRVLLVADLQYQHGFPPIHAMDLGEPSAGWNAVSLTFLKADRLGLYSTYPELQLWPDQIKPTEKAGKSMLLWYFPYQAKPR